MESPSPHPPSLLAAAAPGAPLNLRTLAVATLLAYWAYNLWNLRKKKEVWYTGFLDTC